MRFLPPLVCLLLFVGVPVRGARADGAGASSVTHAQLRGVGHDFTVPAAWTTHAQDGGSGIDFVPPPAAGGHGRLAVSIVLSDATAGQDGKSLIGALVDGEKQKKPHLHDTTPPEPIDFAGAPGQLVILSGSAPSGELEGEMIVVAVVAGTTYVFTCAGPVSEMSAHVEDLAAIIGGVHVAGGVAPGAPSAGLGGALPGGTRKNGPVAAADAFILADGVFGLKVKPMRFWKLAIADDEYQLERTNEAPAVLAIRRVPYASEKKYLRAAGAGGRVRQTQFAGAPATLVERRVGETIERTYHVLRGKYALVFELRVVGRAGESGADARVFELEQAVVFEESAASTYGGVSLATSAGWKLAAVGPGRANFSSARGVEVEVRVRPWPVAKDPFASVEDAMKSRCGKDPYTRSDVAVLGAASAVRFRCASRTAAQVVLVAAGTGSGGERVYVQVTAENRKKKGAPADAEIAEFGAYVALPR